MYMTGITSKYLETFERNLAVTWLKYCRYGVKLYPINQSIERNQEKWPRDTRPPVTKVIKHSCYQELSNFSLQIIVRFHLDQKKIRGLQVNLLGWTKKYVVHNKFENLCPIPLKNDSIKYVQTKHNFKSVTSAQNVNCFAKR